MPTPARPDASRTYDQLQQLEDRATRRLEQAVLAALAALRAALPADAIVEALGAGDLERAVQLAPIAAFVEQLAAVEREFRDLAERAFRVSAADLQRALAAGEVTAAEGAQAALSVSFGAISPHVLQALERDSAQLIREVTDETRAAVRQILTDAYAARLHPREAVQELERLIGLTRRQAAAVERYRAALEAAETPATRVDRLVTRYSDRLRRQRAETIARTEANTAMNAGQRAAWRELTARGLLDAARWEREWLTVLPAPGVCPICLPLDGARAPIDGVFPGGEPGPPAHPNCRCTEVLVRARA